MSSNPFKLRREYYCLHIPTGNVWHNKTADFLTLEEFEARINSWNTQLPITRPWLYSVKPFKDMVLDRMTGK
jgi:hypothetical protein